MSIKIATLCLCVAVGAFAAPLDCVARAYVDIDVAPPAAREEVVVAPRTGYVWAPGYWNWSGHEHVWVAGRHIREHQGHHWVNDSWEQRGSRWHHEGGHWD